MLTAEEAALQNAQWARPAEAEMTVRRSTALEGLADSRLPAWRTGNAMPGIHAAEEKGRKNAQMLQIAEQITLSLLRPKAAAPMTQLRENAH